MKILSLKKQQGTTIVEFTVVASLFFILIFSVIEFGRLLFTWHVLNETSRRVARLASVCQVTTTEQADTISAGIVNSVPLPNFTANNIKVRYLDAFGTEVALPLTTTSNYLQIQFVEASIDSYQIDLTIPLATFGLNFTAPEFKTLLPRESLGVTRTGFTDC
ncbi:TadE/TadG family type IV pilus assembly protein [uncultured Photobacterium sp.]|uniref:TadE/TadG family type IV pilus assembly protein n=1 Tax=uncultured Photobacterium sp. TaxID=173973 RepID=UPI0026115391|nr:TadE family protein [uncultured Photobacterium sp.]